MDEGRIRGRGGLEEKQKRMEQRYYIASQKCFLDKVLAPVALGVRARKRISVKDLVDIRQRLMSRSFQKSLKVILWVQAILFQESKCDNMLQKVVEDTISPEEVLS